MGEVLKLDDVRVHDLRRTGATNMTSEVLGIPRFIVSKVLNHTSDTGTAPLSQVSMTRTSNGRTSEKRWMLGLRGFWRSLAMSEWFGRGIFR